MLFVQKAKIGLFCWFLLSAALPVSRADEDILPADDGIQVGLIEDIASRQIRIYREALVQGSSDQVRMDAAISLLLDRSDSARQILVDTLSQPEPPAAAEAVCRALIKSRALGETIGPRDVFLQPLLGLLSSSSAQTGRLAADALLMFRYEQIAGSLDALFRSPNADKQARLNAIYAYQIRPEPAAIRDLIRLLNDSQPDVSQAAEAALQEVFGIPVGTSRQVWQQILEDLQQKSPDDIRRERLLRQEMRLREIQSERDQWQKMYFSLLDRQYEAADEAGKLALISDRMDSDMAAVRLWALEKAELISGEKLTPLRDKLLKMLGDESRLARLKTAKILNNLSSFDPAERLLERLSVEKDSEVALAMFEALGEACFYAYSPGSKIKLPEQIRLTTLQIANDYLNRQEGEFAKKGAEIIRKLIELNNLDEKIAIFYLERLAERFNQITHPASPLRADLLLVMSQLCSRGAQRNRAGQMYREYFVQHLMSDNPSIRIACASGLAAIDPSSAFQLFKQNNILKDANAALRQIVFEAAGQSAQAEDLGWLEPYIVAGNGQSDAVLASIKSICLRNNADVCLQLAKRLKPQSAIKGFVRELLEISEQKAISDKNDSILPEVRAELSLWFAENGTAADLKGYLEQIQKNGGVFGFPDQTAGLICGQMLGAGYYDLAIEIIRYRLERGSLDAQSEVWRAFDRFFSSASADSGVKISLLERLAGLTGNNDPTWRQQLEAWKTQIANTPTPQAAQ